MLLKFRIRNFEVFNEEVELNLEANLHTKRFLSNVIQSGQGNALKSLAIYGPNNTGKTCIIEALSAYRDILLNNQFHYCENVFTGSHVVELGAEFLYNSARYGYHFAYNTASNEFVREEFCRIEIDSYGNRQERLYFLRNTETKEYSSSDKEFEKVISLSSKDSILIYALDTSGLPLLDEAKKALRNLAESLVILSMHQLSPAKTIEVLKNPDTDDARKVVELIKAADLDIDDYLYSENVKFEIRVDGEKDERLLKAIKNSDAIMDQFRLVTVHKGKSLPSIQFDSNGTKKIIALASYLLDAIKNGKILVLDELDSGLQFKLSRAVISLFNNFINSSAQLICTTHDVSLLDIKTLFRKDQIWFTDKDEKQAYLYSLSNFTAENSGVRSDSDIAEKYGKGIFGALPNPSLVDALLYVGKGEAE